MRLVWLLFWAHLAALLFGVGGLLIALPNPHLWAGSAFGVQVFTFGIRYSGELQIVLGAATMLAYGLVALGWRKTAIFLVVSTLFSAGMELLGTGTGWPFGAYEYTSGLGEKIAGRVPYPIPLSWFSMGLASLLLGSAIAAQRGFRARPLWSLGLGVWLLTAWDLVLDPAMAHPSLPIKFWVWHQVGPYFGMPIENLVGWSLTGLLFMAVSRWLWRADVEPTLPLALPFAIYLANMAFAMILSANVGLWGPILLAVVGGIIPATLAVTGWPRAPRRPLVMSQS